MAGAGSSLYNPTVDCAIESVRSVVENPKVIDANAPFSTELSGCGVGGRFGGRIDGAGLSAEADEPLAILGGKPVRRQKFTRWPIIAENDERTWMEVLRKRRWCRIDGDYANRFEETWGRMMGAKHCVAVANGTSALITSLAALGIGPGDEVLVPPYTFVATINAVLVHHALPVFVDTDPETFQVDARLLESSITEHTACILPVHIGGSAADMDAILAVAATAQAAGPGRRLPGRTWRSGRAGSSARSATSAASASRPPRTSIRAKAARSSPMTTVWRSNAGASRTTAGASVGGLNYARNGANLRMTEFPAALLLTQLTRLEEQSRRREQNAAYLTGLLREIPGITPARMYEGCTRNAYHIYMFRYDPSRFEGLPRSRFLQALNAEGIPARAAISPLYQEPFLKNTLQSRAFQAIYSPKRIADYLERIQCPANERLCEEAVWLMQTDVPRPAVGHGPDRGCDPQDPETGRQAGQGMTSTEPLIGSIRERNSLNHGLHR